MIERPDCLQKLIKYKDKDIIKIITNVCRCGKSYLLFNILSNYLTDNGVDLIINLNILRSSVSIRKMPTHHFVINFIATASLNYNLLLLN